jgi:hypothetical protein
MNVQVGAGSVQMPGFLNVDIRPGPAVDFVGHAGRLSGVENGSVQTLFSHAVYEHIYIGNQIAVLREWKRVIAPDGLIVCIGLPDFSVIARLYIERGPGVVGSRFDLLNVYRYTHGEPEHAVAPIWQTWEPTAGRRAAPPGYIPQLHKGIFDPPYVAALLREVGLCGTIFNYSYPGESQRLNLGFVASASTIDPGLEAVKSALTRVPNAGRFVTEDSIAVCNTSNNDNADQMLLFAKRLDETPAPQRGLVRRAARKISRLLRVASPK